MLVNDLVDEGEHVEHEDLALISPYITTRSAGSAAGSST